MGDDYIARQNIVSRFEYINTSIHELRALSLWIQHKYVKNFADYMVRGVGAVLLPNTSFDPIEDYKFL